MHQFDQMCSNMDFLYQKQLYQEEKIKQLEELIHKLSEDIIGLKQQKHFNIEKIEYRFDQLKVEQLEGTLNIGFSPSEAGKIEEYAVNHTKKQDLCQRIHTQINQYLEKDGPKVIDMLTEKHRLDLSHTYHQRMIDDVRGQMRPRIDYYVEQMSKDNNHNVELERNVMDHTIADIRRALEEHILELKEEGSVRE
jgi:spore germination protein PC